MSSMVQCLLVTLGLTAVPSVSPADQPRDLSPSVEIYRDSFGVPHVYGKTDAGVVFGLAYAQAEDNFVQIERNYIQALGRAAEVFGEDWIADDVFVHRFELPRLAREEYARAPAHMRRLYDAYAAGLNYFLARRPDVKPLLISRFEPWHVVNFYRYMFNVPDDDTIAALGGVSREEMEARLKRDDSIGRGSNGWAIAPSRSASGRAMLFLSPHDEFRGTTTQYEAHVHSESGWQFTGEVFLGGMFPDIGHNSALGWTFTTNYPDTADAYAEDFDDPQAPLAYRSGSGRRLATQWAETLFVRAGEQVSRREIVMRKTHHGPVVAERGGRAVALKLAGIEAGGAAEQLYEMTRARNLTQFRRALAGLRLQIYNVIYADRSGNIMYVYSGKIPRRSREFDWSSALDGSDPRTEWLGFHPLEELPQVLNPKSGFLVSCNSSPFSVTTDGNPERSAFPAYMTRETDNARCQMSRRILESKQKHSLEDLAGYAFDRRVLHAEVEIPRLTAAWQALAPSDAARADRLHAPMLVLRAWDGVSREGSVAMTLFSRWHRRVFAAWYGTFYDSQMPALDVSDEERLNGLEAVVADLEKSWGTWRVPYGDVTRLQRPDAAGDAQFADDSRSLPIAGGSGQLGMIFQFITRAPQGSPRRYGVLGNSFVSVVEFGRRPRARSIIVFGQSADRQSPHYFDQAPLYARGELKPVWSSIRDVKAHSERVYHPGDEANCFDACQRPSLQRIPVRAP